MNNLSMIAVRSPNDLCDTLFAYGVLTSAPMPKDDFRRLYTVFNSIGIVMHDGTSLYFFDENYRKEFCRQCESDYSFWDDFDRIFGEDFSDFFDGYDTEEGEKWIRKSYELALKLAAKRVLTMPYKIITIENIYDTHLINF